jgi:hypothetical protein
MIAALGFMVEAGPPAPAPETHPVMDSASQM